MKYIQKIRYLFTEKWAIHPILFAIFFVLYGYNEMSDSVKISELIYLLVGISLVVTVITFFIPSNNKIRNSIFLSIILLLCLFTEHIFIALQNSIFMAWLAKYRYFVPFVSILFAIFYYFTRKKKLVQANLFLHIISIVYCGIEFYEIFATLYVNNYPTKQETLQKNTLQATTKQVCDTCPDIYLLLTDGYTNSKSLEKYWNFSNQAYIDSLQKLGFYHIKNAQSNYHRTLKSMSAILNMNYTKVGNIEQNRKAQKTAYLEIKNNEVCQKLAEKGYNFHNISPFHIANTEATIYYADNFMLTNLTKFLLHKTIFKIPVANLLKYFENTEPQKYKIDKPIATLENIHRTPHKQPNFVYLHILCPHFPYLFDKNGGQLAKNIQKNPQLAYLEQLQYVNKIIIKLLKNLQKNATKPYIVVLTGDHGSREFDAEIGKQAESYTTSTFFYFPDQNYHILYDSMTSVNLFRAVLHKAIGTNLSYIPDKIINK
jgi:hypothetical protein